MLPPLGISEDLIGLHTFPLGHITAFSRQGLTVGFLLPLLADISVL